MKNHITSAAAIVSSLFVLSCGDSGPSRPTTTTSTSATTAPPVSQFEIVTLLTVNLRRFFNDADNDGWSVDGRHGEGAATDPTTDAATETIPTAGPPK